MIVPVSRSAWRAPQSRRMTSEPTHPERATVPAEAALLTRVLAGDRAALVEIHDRYHPVIHRFVSLQVADPDLAADLTSDVFVRFLEAIDGPRPPQTTLQGWLFGVAKNVVRGHYRRVYRHPEVGLDDALVGSAGHGGDHDGELDTAVARDEERIALADAMQALTEEQQQVLALRYGAGLPILEAAEAMGRTAGAVKQLQARAVAALARQMTQRTASV